MMGFLISCSLVAEDKTLLCPHHSHKPKSEIWVRVCVGGGGGGGTYPKSQGCGAGVCDPPPPPSSIPFLLPLQIPCSPVVAKLICNSCAPSPPPTRLREIKKSTRLLSCWAYVTGLGLIKKYKLQGNLCPIFS